MFESTSQLAVTAIVQDLVAAGVYRTSACAYECDHVVSRHGLNRDAYTQLLTTSTLAAANFAYGRLTSAQVGVDERPDTASGFTPLDVLDQITAVTMDECDDYMNLRKIVAMHAVWLVEDETLSPATGTCSLFLAARDRHQLTLWQSFFEHARRVISIGHFDVATPSDSNAGVSRPSSGMDCDPSLQSSTGTGGVNTQTGWRACVWWSEFSHDAQEEYACSPDRVRPSRSLEPHPSYLLFPSHPFPCGSAGRLEHPHADQDPAGAARGRALLPTAVASAAGVAPLGGAASAGRELPVRVGAASEDAGH